MAEPATNNIIAELHASKTPGEVYARFFTVLPGLVDEYIKKDPAAALLVPETKVMQARGDMPDKMQIAKLSEEIAKEMNGLYKTDDFKTPKPTQQKDIAVVKQKIGEAINRTVKEQKWESSWAKQPKAIEQYIASEGMHSYIANLHSIAQQVEEKRAAKEAKLIKALEGLDDPPIGHLTPVLPASLPRRPAPKSPTLP